MMRARELWRERARKGVVVVFVFCVCQGRAHVRKKNGGRHDRRLPARPACGVHAHPLSVRTAVPPPPQGWRSLTHARRSIFLTTIFGAPAAWSSTSRAPRRSSAGGTNGAGSSARTAAERGEISTPGWTERGGQNFGVTLLTIFRAVSASSDQSCAAAA